MTPFHVVDRLEVIKRHARVEPEKRSGALSEPNERARARVCVRLKEKKRKLVDAQTELGRGPVLVKLVLPFRARERREDARDGLPLGDAQSRLGETRDAADDDDREDENGGEQEPVPHRGRRDHGKLLLLPHRHYRLQQQRAIRRKETRLERRLGQGRCCWPSAEGRGEGVRSRPRTSHKRHAGGEKPARRCRR